MDGDDFQEFKRGLPMAGELRRDDAGQGFAQIDLGVIRLVEQCGEVCRQGPGGVGFSRGAILTVQAEDQFRQDRLTLHR